MRKLIGVYALVASVGLAACSSGLPDGTAATSQGRIIFRSRGATDAAGTGPLLAMNPDGSGLVTLVGSFIGKAPSALSPDGSKLAMPLPALVASILWLDVDSGTVHTLATPHPVSSIVTWTPDSRRLFFFSDNGFPAAFIAIDGSRVQELAGIVPLAFSANGAREAYFGAFGVFGAGTALFVANGDGTGARVVSDTTDTNAPLGPPQLSPDGSQVAYTYGKLYDSSGLRYWLELMVGDVNSGTVRQLTNILADVGAPTWSPDASQLTFGSSANLYVIHADGSGLLQLTTGFGVSKAPNWSPDGKRLAFIMNDDVFIINADGSGLTNLTNSPEIEYDLHWIPK